MQTMACYEFNDNKLASWWYVMGGITRGFCFAFLGYGNHERHGDLMLLFANLAKYRSKYGIVRKKALCKGEWCTRT